VHPDFHNLPSAEVIQNVRERINKQVKRTPVLTCSTIDSLAGARIYFKCENFQKAGAFKFRGASNAVIGLSYEEASRGVATHSSGNHAQALALAARMRGIACHIVMPENAPRIKVNAVRGYGGNITFCAPTLQARESTLMKIIEQTSAIEIHPYNDYRIIAGQATAAAEFTEQIPEVDYIIAPVGGGGLISGTILWARYFAPLVKVIGAEPSMADDACQSFSQKTFIPSLNPQTIADGLRTSLGSLTFPIILQGAEDIITASEESIIQTMFLIWERMKIIVEPSSAVPLAAVMENKEKFTNRKIGIILSGGNADLMNLPWNRDNK
jgi:threonine dehydratase